MDERAKKIIGWVVYLVILLGLVWGTPRALSYFLKTPYPMASITSGSMWPALKRGDLVFIKGVEGKSDVQVGDIVVYKNAKGFTIHRVFQLNEDTLITKGDANNSVDSPVKYEELVGKAVKIGERFFRVPLLGNVSILISRK